jgi:hypothetical protein
MASASPLPISMAAYNANLVTLIEPESVFPHWSACQVPKLGGQEWRGDPMGGLVQ